MQVFDLGIPDGTFETSTISYARRSFGFPSIRKPQIGDLVVIQRPKAKVLYQIETVNNDAIPRYEDIPEYKFWTGIMRDVIETRTLTPEIEKALSG